MSHLIKTCLDILPSEIWDNLFNYLSKKDQRTCSKVCKVFYNLIVVASYKKEIEWQDIFFQKMVYFLSLQKIDTENLTKDIGIETILLKNTYKTSLEEFPLSKEYRIIPRFECRGIIDTNKVDKRIIEIFTDILNKSDIKEENLVAIVGKFQNESNIRAVIITNQLINEMVQGCAFYALMEYEKSTGNK